MRKLRSLTAGLFLFCGLPLLGWGIFHMGAFFDNFARTLYMILMAIATLLVVILVPEEGRSRGEGTQPVSRQKWAVRYLQVIALFVVIAGPYFDRHEILILRESDFLRGFGIGIGLVGYFFMNWAVIALGRQFSTDVTLQDGHQLITSGPYRRIRHPRYLGILIFLAGLSLTFRSLVSLLSVIVTFGVIVWRIHDEENLMEHQFSRQWTEYKLKTKALIPFLF